MKSHSSYFAKADSAIALEIANAVSPFSIEVRFLGGLTQSQMAVFARAADRWCKIIVGDLPSVQVDGETVDDLLIVAQGLNIDGPGKVLGQAGPTHLRPPNAGSYAFLPAKGTMAFDIADLNQMEANGTLLDVITHEMGHVLGIGTIWKEKGLLKKAGTTNPFFSGVAASEEFGILKGTSPTPVPVENSGGLGTQDSHWRETVFKNELMSGFISGQNNPISRITAASLKDIGYQVNMNAAEPFALPNLLELAEAGLLITPNTLIDRVLINIPLILPEDSLL